MKSSRPPGLYPPGAPVELDALAQALGNGERAALPPERGIATLCEAVVQHDEVADDLHLIDQPRVVRIDVGLIEVAVGEMLEQVVDAARHQVAAGRLEGLEK